MKTESCQIEDELKSANDLLAQSKYLTKADQEVIVAINDNGHKDKLSVLLKQWEQTSVDIKVEAENLIRAIETVIIDIPLRRCEQYMTNRRNMEQLKHYLWQKYY